MWIDVFSVHFSSHSEFESRFYSSCTCSVLGGRFGFL